jgi:hypothetical protein
LGTKHLGSSSGLRGLQTTVPCNVLGAHVSYWSTRGVEELTSLHGISWQHIHSRSPPVVLPYLQQSYPAELPTPWLHLQPLSHFLPVEVHRCTAASACRSTPAPSPDTYQQPGRVVSRPPLDCAAQCIDGDDGHWPLQPLAGGGAGGALREPGLNEAPLVPAPFAWQKGLRFHQSSAKEQHTCIGSRLSAAKGCRRKGTRRWPGSRLGPVAPMLRHSRSTQTF